MEIWFIILDRSLYINDFIAVYLADDIAWFANRSTSSLPLIPIYEGAYMNSMVFFELGIILIICCEIAYDGLGDSNEVKALRESLMIRAFI